MTHAMTKKEINSAKANMAHIYGELDPRPYFCELQKVDYKIPDHAKPVFASLIRHIQGCKGAPVRALDLGCSYGVNAALLKYDLGMDDLYARWTDPVLDQAAPEQVADSDRRFFADLPVASSVEIVGLDPSEPAIAYGEYTGLLDQGLVLNLEDDPLTDAATKALAPVDLVMSTGCVGYVTEKSFGKLLPAVMQGRSPWFANYVLRMFPFEMIEQELAAGGYVTEKLDGYHFVQRSFASDVEQENVLDRLAAQGLDSAGEAQGQLIAELYLSRPDHEATLPLRELAGI